MGFSSCLSFVVAFVTVGEQEDGSLTSSRADFDFVVPLELEGFGAFLASSLSVTGAFGLKTLEVSEIGKIL